MGDVPPKEGDGVGKIRGTSQVTVFRLLFPPLPMKMAAKQDLGVWYFWLLWSSEGGPRGEGWVRYHLRRGTGRTNHRDFTGDRFQVIVLLFTYENGGG